MHRAMQEPLHWQPADLNRITIPALEFTDLLSSAFTLCLGELDPPLPPALAGPTHPSAQQQEAYATSHLHRNHRGGKTRPQSDDEAIYRSGHYQTTRQHPTPPFRWPRPRPVPPINKLPPAILEYILELAGSACLEDYICVPSNHVQPTAAAAAAPQARRHPTKWEVQREAPILTSCQCLRC